MSLSDEVRGFFDKMDPDLMDLQEMEGFEEVANGIYHESKKLADELATDGMDRIAFILVMQSEAINKLVDEIEELRPSIRFITSALLGNTEADGDA